MGKERLSRRELRRRNGRARWLLWAPWQVVVLVAVLALPVTIPLSLWFGGGPDTLRSIREFPAALKHVRDLELEISRYLDTKE